ncbi:MAG: DUF4012 domain-containing protein, partial [Candidatus Doudnabacteria bacterium]|nr:DUF4012 domain-containing protein [Candidatus Doudnabacteria bacterium]
RDSNWFADFPTTAEKLLSFFEMSSETADGVIALTPNIFVEILKLIGPVPMPEYDVVLTPENFQDVVQNQTSVSYDKELNQPKKFLDDFAPVMLNKMTDLGKEQWFTLFQIMKDSFSQKHILVYSTDHDTQSKIMNMGFDGRILEAEHDYLSVVNSNLGGTKTDLDVKQSIDYVSNIQTDGNIINEVTVTRKNTSDMPNRNFMRILVPSGSRFLEASGFTAQPQYSSQVPDYDLDPDLVEWDKGFQVGDVQVRSEGNKTEFTGWNETLGNSETVVKIKYALPLKISFGLLNTKSSYSLVFQKQSGSRATNFNGQINTDGLNIPWSTENTAREKNSVKFQSLGTTDEYWGMVLSR